MAADPSVDEVSIARTKRLRLHAGQGTAESLVMAVEPVHFLVQQMLKHALSCSLRDRLAEHNPQGHEGRVESPRGQTKTGQHSTPDRHPGHGCVSIDAAGAKGADNVHDPADKDCENCLGRSDKQRSDDGEAEEAGLTALGEDEEVLPRGATSGILSTIWFVAMGFA